MYTFEWENSHTYKPSSMLKLSSTRYQHKTTTKEHAEFQIVPHSSEPIFVFKLFLPKGHSNDGSFCASSDYAYSCKEKCMG